MDDIFKIYDICLPQVSVNCDLHIYKDIALDVLYTPCPSPSPVDHIVNSMMNTYLMYRDPDSCFPVIFDTSAS